MTATGPLAITTLVAADLPEIAETHVRVWQEAYAGQMPQDFLDALDSAARLERWKETFGHNKDDPRYGTLVAHIDGVMAGFLSYGPARDAGRENMFETYAINIRKAFWSAGVGYRLFQECCRQLKSQGASQTYLWVLMTNDRAIKAYKRWGGKIEDKTKEIEIGGKRLKEVSVLFEAL